MAETKNFQKLSEKPKNETNSSDETITTNPNFRITPNVYSEISNK